MWFSFNLICVTIFIHFLNCFLSTKITDVLEHDFFPTKRHLRFTIYTKRSAERVTLNINVKRDFEYMLFVKRENRAHVVCKAEN